MRERIVFETDTVIKERYDRLIKSLGRGIPTMLMETVLTELLDCIEENPAGIVGLILTKKLHLADVSPSIRQALEAKREVDPKKVNAFLKSREG